MELWIAAFGWLLLIGYFFSMFAKPSWHFDYDNRVPKIEAISSWWWSKGYSENIFIALRWIVNTGIIWTIFRFCLRVYQNS